MRCLAALMLPYLAACGGGRASAPAVTSTGGAMSAPPLEVIDLALAHIEKDYVDPQRVKPQVMLAAALDGMQRDIAEVMTSQPDAVHVAVQVNAKLRSFATDDVTTLVALEHRLAEIFAFVRANLDPGRDFAKLEYAALNGMLDSLDPHSNILSPDEAREMAEGIDGKFGGLGIGIRDKDHYIEVERLVDGNTPARRAGLQVNDRIMVIDGESTENIDLDAAMQKLRGDPDTTVALTISRKGVAKPYQIKRAVVIVPGTQHQLLANHVGYVRVLQFQHDVALEVAGALADLRRQGAKSWVLDLRDNPGGLLNESIALVDLFVDKGTITTTVGASIHDQSDATADQHEEHSGLVVLVNGATASDAEVHAGALAKLARATILGQRSFGKGSVQVLFDNPDHSKLKLTIAQYLVGKDTSVQGVGITPDIELAPALVPVKLATEKDVLRLSSPTLPREADYQSKLTSEHAVAGTARSAISYLFEAPPGTGGFFEDGEIRIARDLAAAPRAELLDGSAKELAATREREQTKVAAAMKKLAIDWSGDPAPTSELSATFTVDKPTATAGDVIAITGEVTNHGKAMAFQVHARAASDDGNLDGTELAFGAIAPQASKRAVAYIKLPVVAESRTEVMAWSLAGTERAMPKFHVEALPHPQFAFTYALGDKGNLAVHITNTGRGKALAAAVLAASKEASIKTGRQELGVLEPGASKEVAFEITPKKSPYVVEVGVGDEQLLELTGQKLHFPTTPGGAVSPPIVELETTSLDTTGDHWTLSGRARDDRHVRDAFVLVTNQAAKIADKKVLYLSNDKGADRTVLDLAGSIPLWPGTNKIEIVVREDDQVRTVRTVWVQRGT
ncbi:hypothetical protein BH11MYX1_BH11MYX1_27520 [soil metagenome]